MKTEFAVIAALLLSACTGQPLTHHQQVVCSGGFRDTGYEITFASRSTHVRIVKGWNDKVFYTPVPGETCIISEIQHDH